MELSDLYDAHRNKLGITLKRGEKNPEGCYTIVIHCVIFNEDGDKMLIQKRVKTKSKFPDLWDVTCGGNAIAGEESYQTAKRELNEELGLLEDFEKINPSITFHTSKVFDDVYILQRDVDLNSLKLQESEVEQVRWATEAEILNMIDEQSFIPYRKEYISLLFAMKTGSPRLS